MIIKPNSKYIKDTAEYVLEQYDGDMSFYFFDDYNKVNNIKYLLANLIYKDISTFTTAFLLVLVNEY